LYLILILFYLGGYDCHWFLCEATVPVEATYG
jgi:hypothetical protein